MKVKLLEIYEYEKEYPKVGPTVDGRIVGDDISNTDSIRASLYNYIVCDDLREIPILAFEDNGKPSFYSIREKERVEELANDIKISGRIDPLIVVIDEEGLYVLEGSHRFDALKLLDAKSFPALLVVDTDTE